ncbi:ComF family protein [Thiomonas sp.]|uniref:ComF family protein n=1 Tax=Thiomonas sp. TaxID=2047785 RepID=UPI00262DE037|nr:ComF family protein [Thiomonas sp.]
MSARVPPPPRNLFAALLRALLPDGRCRLCGLPSRAPLCSACQCERPAHWRCPRCALALGGPAALCGNCALRRPAFAGTLAWGDYAAPWDRLVAQFKFGDDAALARWLGMLLGQRLRAERPGWAPPRCVVPVPLSAARLRRRGYNQAWELARGLAAELGWPCDCTLLQRRREGPAQSELRLVQRAANVRGAFVAAPLARGARLLLVDDVMTSGNTAEHACRALLRAGADDVRVAVLLRTPAPMPR